jgi:hypothetical protein
MKHSLSHGIVATCRYFALRLLVAAAGVLFFHSAQAGVFDYEPFSTATYNENQQLGKSVGTFTIGNSGGTGSSIVSNAAQLTYSGLLCDTGSRGVARVTNVTTSNRQAGKNITLTSSGSVYCSFLLKVLDAPVSNRCLIVFGSAADQSNPVNAGVFMDSDRKLHASKQNLTTIGDPTPNALDLNTTNLVVFRYTFGSPAAADIWLNPPTDKFGVDEASVPAADVSMTSGGSPTSLGCYSLPQGRGDTSTSTGYGSGSGLLHMDEIRIADNWAEVTPAIGTCTAAGVVSSPINKTATAETTVTFSVNGSGTFPTYQWQLSTNGGTTWNHISSATNSTYTTPTLTLANNGNQYRAIVIVSCSGGSSDTSSVATLTVTAPVITPVGLILDDIWTDGNRTDGPVGISNSVWRASSAGNLVMDGTTMVGSAASGSSRLFVGYFVDDTSSNVPVHLDVGRAIKSTVVFTPINVVAQGGNSIRVGLVDYADGATRVTGDGFQYHHSHGILCAKRERLGSLGDWDFSGARPNWRRR